MRCYALHQKVKCAIVLRKSVPGAKPLIPPHREQEHSYGGCGEVTSRPQQHDWLCGQDHGAEQLIFFPDSSSGPVEKKILSVYLFVEQLVSIWLVFVSILYVFCLALKKWLVCGASGQTLLLFPRPSFRFKTQQISVSVWTQLGS